MLWRYIFFFSSFGLLIIFPFPITHELSPERDAAVSWRAPPPHPTLCLSPWVVGWRAVAEPGPGRSVPGPRAEPRALVLPYQGMIPCSCSSSSPWAQPCDHRAVTESPERPGFNVCTSKIKSGVSGGADTELIRLEWVSLTVHMYGLSVAFLSWVLKSGQMTPADSRLVHLQLGMAQL